MFFDVEFKYLSYLVMKVITVMLMMMEDRDLQNHSEGGQEVSGRILVNADL